jgi:hypothetical protein
MASPYITIRDFGKHLLPLPERISTVVFSQLEFAEGFHPNNYILYYYLRNKFTRVELPRVQINFKLDPMRQTLTNIRLLEEIPIGIGYEIMVQFATLEIPQKPSTIAVKIAYQVFF